MFASFDPVALDVACADAVNKQPVIAGSILEEHMQEHQEESDDYFHLVSPNTSWRSCVEHAEKDWHWSSILRTN